MVARKKSCIYRHFRALSRALWRGRDKVIGPANVPVAAVPQYAPPAAAAL
jgi:hypothetical protein